jgi:putative endonuclease
VLLWPFDARRLLADPKRLGCWGENQALRFSARRGLRTIARNFRCDAASWTLIMADPEAVAFVEVKTRRNEDFAQPGCGNAGKRHR